MFLSAVAFDYDRYSVRLVTVPRRVTAPRFVTALEGIQSDNRIRRHLDGLWPAIAARTGPFDHPDALFAANLDPRLQRIQVTVLARFLPVNGRVRLLLDIGRSAQSDRRYQSGACGDFETSC